MATINENKATSEILIALAQKGIQTPDQVEAVKADILASIPPSVKETMADMSEDEQVLKFMNTYFLSKDGIDPQMNQPDPTQKKETAPVTPMVSAEDAASIQNYYDLHAEKMNLRANRSRVVCVLTDKPVLAAIHVKGAKLKPTISENTEKKFDEWQDKLVNTDANKQAFAEMKASFMKGEMMEVYINPEAKEKVIGYKIETTDDNNQPATMVLTKDDARDFLLTKVLGVIAATSENNIGIAIRFVKKNNSSASDNEKGGKQGTIRIAIQNAKAMKDNPSLKVCTCSIVETGGQRQVNDQYNAKTAKYFEVIMKEEPNKEQRTRKVRLSGKTSVYTVERNAEYVAAFGQATRTKGVGVMSNKEKAKVEDNCRQAMAMLLNDRNQVTTNAMRTALAEIRRGKASVKADDFS